jgi:methionyl-tRNA synthetase
MDMNKTSGRQILVTSALYYANGSLHLGHILETIQSDIWVRYQRHLGNRCIHISGSDAHGTPIMLQAEKRQMSPEKMVQEIHLEHKQEFSEFHIAFDNFHTTHSEENKQLSELIYERLKAKGDIETKTITQAYDAQKEMFLPDRYVKGECPKCKAKDQYGDSCEVCGATYSPTELINPISVVSGTKPIEKQSEHYFFKLENYTALLEDWTKQGHLQQQIVNKLNEWFAAGLRQWDITRDGPYFGFPIPGTTNKFFYVWLDAPIGYMASFKDWCQRHDPKDFDAFWQKDSKHELYHFIGKDIVYFHALFWPAILAGSNFRTPSAIFAHGFLTINGQKMSKSRGTFITGRNYLNHLNPEYLRYYLAAKLNDGVDDIDLSFDDFTARVNADLVGKYVNIASRCAPFITKNFNGKLSTELMNPELMAKFLEKSTHIQEGFESRQYHKAIREIMGLADLANQFVDENKPWELAKSQDNMPKVQMVCTTALNLFRILTIYLKPVLPIVAQKVEKFFAVKPFTWQDLQQPLLGHTINVYEPLMMRVDPKHVEALLEQGKKMQETTTEAKPNQTNHISIDDFSKVDLRIARIVNAESVEGADKLVKLTVSLGDSERTIFAGIKASFNLEDLIGKMTIIVANLAPRKMRFGVSEGMVIVAGGEDGKLFLLEPQVGAEPGMRVK